MFKFNAIIKHSLLLIICIVLCGCSGKKLSANNMTPYEYARYMGDVFACGDGSLWMNSNIISAKTASLTRWDPCEDLSKEDNEESPVALEFIGVSENEKIPAVICRIINNGSEILTSDYVGLNVKLGDEWYWALNIYSSTLEFKNFILYPGESIGAGVTLYNDKNIVPPGHYRLIYSGTEPPAYLEFDLTEKDGVLSAVPAE